MQEGVWLSNWVRPICSNSFFLCGDIKEWQLNNSLYPMFAMCRRVFRHTPEEHPLMRTKVDQRELRRAKRRIRQTRITHRFEMLPVFL